MQSLEYSITKDAAAPRTITGRFGRFYKIPPKQIMLLLSAAASFIFPFSELSVIY